MVTTTNYLTNLGNSVNIGQFEVTCLLHNPAGFLWDALEQLYEILRFRIRHLVVQEDDKSWDARHGFPISHSDLLVVVTCKDGHTNDLSCGVEKFAGSIRDIIQLLDKSAV